MVRSKGKSFYKKARLYRRIGFSHRRHSELQPPQTVLVFDLGVAFTPIRNLPATFLYCRPITVLKRNFGHVIILPPVDYL